MPSFQKKEFTPALPQKVTFTLKDNPFEDTAENFPKQLSLFIPLDSVHAFATHLMNMADEQSKHKSGKTWDNQAKEEVQVDGIYLNANAREGQWGAFGNINPAKLEVAGASF